MTRPRAIVESVKSTIKKYILESFSKCTGISNIIKVGWKCSRRLDWSRRSHVHQILFLFLAECRPLSRWTCRYLPLAAETVETRSERYFGGVVGFGLRSEKTSDLSETVRDWA